MRKKLVGITLLCFIVIALLFLILNLLVRKSYIEIGYWGWQPIEILDFGTIRVPPNWEYEEVDGFMYFFVEESGKKNFVLVESASSNEKNKHLDSFENVTLIQSAVYSNGAFLRKSNYSLSGTSTQSLYEINVSRYNSATKSIQNVFFLCLDPNISEDLLIRIAKSFAPN